MNFVTKLKITNKHEGLDIGWLNGIKSGLFAEMNEQGFAYLKRTYDDWYGNRSILTMSEKGKAALKTALVIRSATPVSLEAAWNMLQNYTQMYGHCPELAALYGQKQRMCKETASESVCAG